MYTWEIQNWLRANNNVFMTARLFFEMMENSPQVTYMKLGQVYTDTFEMYIGTISYLSGFMLEIAWLIVITEISCSTDFPPKKTPNFIIF